MPKKEITLFSSAGRPQYLKDILNVLALPHHSKYRFRYKDKYIHKELVAFLDHESKNFSEEDTLVLIAFRSEFGECEEFIIPVRWAYIVKVEKSEDFYLIDFIVTDYVIFKDEFKKCKSIDEIASITEYFLDEKEKKYFVVKNIPDVVVPYVNDSKTRHDKAHDLWLKVIEKLHYYKKLQNCYFFKTTTFKDRETDNQNKTSSAQKNKLNIIRSGNRIIINIKFNNFSDVCDSEINIDFDKSLLIPSGDSRTFVECRYDSVSYAFQAKKVISTTDTQIKLKCKSCNDDKKREVETTIKVPLTIKRNLVTPIIKSIISFLGALAIGIPGVWPEIHITCKMSLFIVGSLFIALNWFMPSKE